MKRRVVITGIGAITPNGNTAAEFWQNSLNGISGAGPITLFDTTGFDTTFACEVKNFNPADFIDTKEAKRMDRFTQLGLAATEMAIKDSGLEIEKEDLTRIGVVTGSGIGGMQTFEDQHKALLNRGPSRVSPFFIVMLIPDIVPGRISIRYGFKGPNYGTVSACATSSHAIGDACRIIQYGDADVMITGGCESVITPISIAGFSSMKALSTRNDEPKKASRPFDIARDGFVMGEGAGMIVLEELEHAKKRNANIIGELAGFGMTADAYHLTAPAPEGEGAKRSMENAIKDAKINSDEIAYINAHGTSTPLGDLAEMQAVTSIFGEKNVRVSSTKSMTGHLLGGAGAIEFIILAKAVQNDVAPPTINVENQDPEIKLNVIPNVAQEFKINAGLSNTFGFGGHNTSLLVKKFV
ncbi:beta-ketoacyl-ACP synthase II [bacterium]|nr:beta-ketoacyl-ACP synthase II [bacterium]